MSDYIGTNLKSKIIKILNLFLSISDSNNGKDDNIEKKKKRKKKKQSEKEIQENIMSASFQSNNSENST